MGNQSPQAKAGLPNSAKDLKYSVSPVDCTFGSVEGCAKYSIIPSSLNTEDPNTISVLCISDTHSLESKMENTRLPPADILVHAGDFTNVGKKKEVQEFVNWLEEHLDRGDFKHIVLIAGNHDTTFHKEFFMAPGGGNRFFRNKTNIDCDAIRDIVLDSRIVYLEDESAELFGVKLYGSPWQPYFCNWAFNLQRGEECREKWEQIPESIDILITHGPPAFHGDKTMPAKDNVGCLDLLKKIEQIQPQFHVFGHIHEGYGVTQQTNLKTYFINASTCNLTYRPNQDPIMFYIAGNRDASAKIPDRSKT